MAGIKEYKCPNCGGALEFDAKLQKLKCPFCDSEFEMSQFAEVDGDSLSDEVDAGEDASAQHADFETPSDNSWSDSEKDQMMVYTCQSCGGEVIASKERGADRCPYCGNNVIVASQFSGGIRPDYVLPFMKTKKEAIELLRQHIGKYPFAPAEFSLDETLEKTEGIYIPFWLFDAKANFDMNYEVTRPGGHLVQGDYEIEIINHYNVHKAGTGDFVMVPADASRRMADDLMDSLEPFDLDKRVKFDMGYLAGYLADRYDVTAEENEPRVNKRMEMTIRDSVRDSIKEAATPRGGDIRIFDGMAYYAMVPVWLMTVRFKDDVYHYAVNGQTGKTIGEIPYDSRAFVKYLLKHFGIYSAIAIPLIFAFMYFS